MSVGANILGLAKSLRALADVPAQIAKTVAGDLNRRIQAGFDAGSDPYGAAWGALKPATIAKGRTPPPLTDSGALRGNTYLEPMAGAGLQLAGGFFSYGVYHMQGTARMVKRRFFPDAGLPASWREDIQAAYTDVLKKAMGK